MSKNLLKYLFISVSVLIFIISITISYSFISKEKNNPNKLSVKNIYTKNIKYTDLKQIENIVSKVKNQYIYDIDEERLSEELIKLPFIKSAKVINKYPNSLIIDIKERDILFILDNNFGIDSDFTIIDQDISKYNIDKNIIRIYGDFTEEKLKKLFKELSEVPLIKNRIKSIELISNRRWNIVIYSNNRYILIKLPEYNIKETINKFLKETYKTDLFNTNFNTIDLRSDKIIIE